MKKYILFDLDGTLTDPREGITACVQYALKDFGIEEPDQEKLEPFIGPPLKDSFMKYYNMTEEQAERAIAKYRERFQDTGIFENELYGGIHDLLRSLKNGGMHLAVASSKPTVYVERILKHFKIDKYFEVVVGSELDGTRVEKPQVLQEVFLRFFPDHMIPYDQFCMVGDRKYDIDGARTFRVESIGVTYGYGSREELEEAKADHIVESVTELKKLLMKDVEAAQVKKTRENTDPNAAAKKPRDNKIMWRMLVPFAMFYLIRLIGASLITSGFQMICTHMPVLEPFFWVVDEAAGTKSITANGYVLSQLGGFLAAAFAIRNYAKQAIAKTRREALEAGVKKEPVKNYVFAGAAVVAAAIGWSQMVVESGVLTAAQTQSSAHLQYDASMILGIACFGLIIPAIEEFMFRGIVYNCTRRFMKRNMALLVSAFIFSAFYNDTTQSMYAFVIGYLCAYAYEVFGNNFYVPLALHAASATLLHILTRAGLAGVLPTGMPAAIVFFVIAIAALVLLEREKKQMSSSVIAG